jgi:translocator protein
MPIVIESQQNKLIAMALLILLRCNRGNMTLLAAILALLLITQIESFSPKRLLSPISRLGQKHFIEWHPSPRRPCRRQGPETLFPSVANPHRHIKVSPTAIASLGPTVASSVGHVIAGTLATPFVIKAVKTWYARIPLPTWTPPNNIFAPVWTFLYASIGVAVARVARVKGWQSIPVVLWSLHMALNLSWAPLFFGMAKLRAGLVVQCMMVASLPVLMVMFAAVDSTAALLLMPYMAWISFATVLNYAICKLNPMDGTGYSNAMLEADIAKLQKEAAQKVGL